MTATAEAATHLSVGDGITDYAQMLALPIGTKIGPAGRGASAWVKVERASWENLTDGTASLTHYKNFTLRNYNTVKELPSGEVPMMTIQQWQWRWLDHIWASAETAGVASVTVTGAEQQLGIDESTFPIGAGVRMKSNRFRSRLPVGSLIYTGTPEVLSRFGVYRTVEHGGTVRAVLGDYRSSTAGLPVTVLSVPDGTVADWANAPGTEEDQEAIAAFKARSWLVGWKVKSQQSWCSTYESYMAQMAMTPDVLGDTRYNGISIGDRVDPIQAAALPPHSVLRWRKGDGTDWAWFRRADEANNRARTQRLFGPETGSQRNYATSMEVLWIGNGHPWAIPLTTDEAECLPPGARVTYDGAVYRMAMDRRLTGNSNRVEERGTWLPSQFDNLRLVNA
jgi:hypothetical protein